MGTIVDTSKEKDYDSHMAGPRHVQNVKHKAQGIPIIKQCKKKEVPYEGISKNLPRGEKECKICECKVQLKDYGAHMAGARHLQNIKNRAEGLAPQAIKGKGRRAGAGRQPGGSKIKSICAEDLINDSVLPIIGLDEITEYQSNKHNVHTSYQCALCNTNQNVHSLIQHITGRLHRLNYLKKHHEDWAKEVMEKQEEINNLVPEGHERTVAMRCIIPLLEDFARKIEFETGRGQMTVVEDHSTQCSAPTPPSVNTSIEQKIEQKTSSEFNVNNNDRVAAFNNHYSYEINNAQPYFNNRPILCEQPSKLISSLHK